MKNIRFFAVALAAFALFSLSTNAQPKAHNNWQERMMSEKIAFITSELDLSPEEAQAFWPVYNQIAKDQAVKQKNVKEALNALKQALTEGKDSKEIDKLLDKYLMAKQENNINCKEFADKYRKVLSSEKVAKLYLSEEKFRRMHIKNLGAPKGNGGHGKPHDGKPSGRR